MENVRPVRGRVNRSCGQRTGLAATGRRLMVSSGQRACGAVSSVSVSPSARRSAPAHAIMAPLSVHSSAGGTTSAVPVSNAMRCSTLRIASLAATPPAATSAVGLPITLLEHLHAGAQPVGDHVDHGLLERSAQIADVVVAQRRDLLGFEPQRGLQAREREVRVRPAVHRTRQHEASDDCRCAASRSTCGPPG